MRAWPVWSASSTDPVRRQTPDLPYHYVTVHANYITCKNDIKYLHRLNEENQPLRGFASHESSQNR